MRLIESRAFWLTWAALFVAMMAQQAVNAPFRQYAGEFVVFMIASIYTLVESIRNGLWDRHFEPTTGMNLLCSLGTGLLMAVYQGVRFYVMYGSEQPLWMALVMGLIFGGSTAILTFGVCQLALVSYNKRHKELESDDNEEE